MVTATAAAAVMAVVMLSRRRLRLPPLLRVRVRHPHGWRACPCTRCMAAASTLARQTTLRLLPATRPPPRYLLPWRLLYNLSLQRIVCHHVRPLC